MDWSAIFNINVFNFIAGLASILGLAISGWVLWDLKRIEDTYLLKASAPRLRSKISAHREKLSLCLQNYPASFREAEEEISRLKPTLATLRSIYKKKGLASLTQITEMLEATPLKQDSDEGLRKIYNKLIEVEGEIGESQEVESLKR